MSVMVKDSLGRWVQAAGQGKAEYGASTVRTGTVTAELSKYGEAGWTRIFQVTFDTPMPDNDYLIELGINYGDCTAQVITSRPDKPKTKNGFYFLCLNFAGVAQSPIVSYTAFKLYTDTEYNQVLAALPPVDTVTDGNMKAVTSNAVYDALSNVVVTAADVVEDGNMNPVTSNAVYDALGNVVVTPADVVADGNMNPVTSNAVYDALQSLPHYSNNAVTIEIHGEVSYDDLIENFSNATNLAGGHLFHFGFYHEGNDSNTNWVVGRPGHNMTFGKPNETYDTYSDGIEQTINLDLALRSDGLWTTFNIHNRLSNNTTLTRSFRYNYNKNLNTLYVEIMDEYGSTLYAKNVNNSSDWASFAPNLSAALSQLHAEWLTLTIEQIF